MRSHIVLLASTLLFAVSSIATAEEREFVDHSGMLMDHGGGHLMDMGGGMVMGQNTDTLPGGCDSISKDVEITVRAGHQYAKPFPGRMYAFDQQEYNFDGCTRLTVNFINEDNVRHQWMVHGLPKYLYPKGMFHLEVTGPGKITGTLILPPEDQTYLVHCDLAQHMEKGMKAQMKVGKGSGDLPSIPGITDYAIPDVYSMGPPPAAPSVAAPAVAAPGGQVQTPWISGVLVIGLAIGLIGAAYSAKKFKGMSASEITAYLLGRITAAVNMVAKAVGGLIRLIRSLFGGGSKELPEK